jgi:hypothetical protein
MGLASQWYTSTSQEETELAIKDIIGIPESLTIYDMMVIGYQPNLPNNKILRNLAERYTMIIAKYKMSGRTRK